MTKGLIFCIILFFTQGCTTLTQEKLSETLQSNGATQLRKDYKNITHSLIVYKQKLDLRNPKAFSKESARMIVDDMERSLNSIRFIYKGKTLVHYDEYFRVAFDPSPTISDRNDFLMVGLHKLLWESYQIGKGHHMTTLSFHQENFKKLYYYLEVIKWKIRTAKDPHGNYLFLTWQNNWQVELSMRLKQGEKPSWELIQNLPSLKNGKESLFDPSNPNFEILLNQIIAYVKNSARIVGDEPLDVGLEAMKSLVLFL